MTAIVADRLTKWYGARRAVEHVSFEVATGEVMGLLGPNGSGKTTILRILTGFLRPSSGTARVAGVDIVEEPLGARRRVGYVPEDAPLYDWMRVREFLVFMARIKRTDGGEREAVDHVVERFGLAGVQGMPIGKLSRGFRQRVAIAQALVNDPPVLVLDEPTNGLDPRQIAEMRALVRSLAGSHTVLVASHVLVEVERVADRAAILLSGRLLAVHPIHRGAPGTRFRLVARGEPAAVCASAERVPGVTGVAPGGPPRDPGFVACTLTLETPRVAETLAAGLLAQGIRLVEIGEERPDLESVFLALTATDSERQP